MKEVAEDMFSRHSYDFDNFFQAVEKNMLITIKKLVSNYGGDIFYGHI